ncbi:MAG: response regulator transcription factor [Sphingomonas sp.]
MEPFRACSHFRAREKPRSNIPQSASARDRTLIAQGKSAKEIARSTTLAPRTVERHLDECRQKLNAKNNAQLAAIAASTGDLSSYP